MWRIAVKSGPLFFISCVVSKAGHFLYHIDTGGDTMRGRRRGDPWFSLENKDDPNYKPHYGNSYTQRQLDIINGEIDLDNIRPNELSIIFRKALQMEDPDTYEILRRPRGWVSFFSSTWGEPPPTSTPAGTRRPSRGPSPWEPRSPTPNAPWRGTWACGNPRPPCAGKTARTGSSGRPDWTGSP